VCYQRKVVAAAALAVVVAVDIGAWPEAVP